MDPQALLDRVEAIIEKCAGLGTGTQAEVDAIVQSISSNVRSELDKLIANAIEQARRWYSLAASRFQSPSTSNNAADFDSYETSPSVGHFEADAERGAPMQEPAVACQKLAHETRDASFSRGPPCRLAAVAGESESSRRTPRLDAVTSKVSNERTNPHLPKPSASSSMPPSLKAAHKPPSSSLLPSDSGSSSTIAGISSQHTSLHRQPIGCFSTAASPPRSSLPSSDPQLSSTTTNTPSQPTSSYKRKAHSHPDAATRAKASYRPSSPLPHSDRQHVSNVVSTASDRIDIKASLSRQDPPR